MTDIAIKVQNLSKCYQIYDNPRDRLKQFAIPKLHRVASPLRNVHAMISANSSFDKLRTNGIGVSSAKIISCTFLRRVFPARPLGHSIRSPHFMVLTDIAEFLYKTTNYCAPELERSIALNNAALNIDWLLTDTLISTKDQSNVSLKSVEVFA